MTKNETDFTVKIDVKWFWLTHVINEWFYIESCQDQVKHFSINFIIKKLNFLF